MRFPTDDDEVERECEILVERGRGCWRSVREMSDRWLEWLPSSFRERRRDETVGVGKEDMSVS
jgi:hypothetical protein